MKDASKTQTMQAPIIFNFQLSVVQAGGPISREFFESVSWDFLVPASYQAVSCVRGRPMRKHSWIYHDNGRG